MRHLIFNLIMIIVTGILTGCISEQRQTEKARELTVAIVENEDIPEELLGQIEKKKEKAFRMSYEDAGVLYIAEGYGAQQKTGYSVEVAECYETENAVYFHSHLMGPEKGEEVQEIKSFPYIVIATQAIGKPVIFD